MKRLYNRTFGFYIGKMKLKDILPRDVQLAINIMQKNGVSNSSLRDSLGRLKESFEYAIADRLISYNPTIVIEVPWPDKKQRKKFLLINSNRRNF